MIADSDIMSKDKNQYAQHFMYHKHILAFIKNVTIFRSKFLLHISAAAAFEIIISICWRFSTWISILLVRHRCSKCIMRFMENYIFVRLAFVRLLHSFSWLLLLLVYLCVEKQYAWQMTVCLTILMLMAWRIFMTISPILKLCTFSTHKSQDAISHCFCLPLIRVFFHIFHFECHLVE